MKHIIQLTLIFTLAITAFSCKSDDENYPEVVQIDKVPIDSVKLVSNTMKVNEVQSIRTYSTYGNGCQDFYEYDYQKLNFDRNVTAYSFTHNGVCTQALHTEMSQFTFQPVVPGTYTFNFWQSDTSTITETIVVTP